MTIHKIKIGNAQGFWGDRPGAAAELLRLQPDLDFITLDYLAEVSMSIMAIQKEKNPTVGYARDFLDVVASLTPYWKQGSKVKLVSNAGGLNPQGCANAVIEVLKKCGAPPLKIGVVSGDDVLENLKTDPKNPLYKHLENGNELDTVLGKLVTANAYLGAQGIAEALNNGADIVITGRVADPSLTVGPCASAFNWDWENYQALAGATVAGHLLECGTQVTGGILTRWEKVPNLASLGFPFAEIQRDGSFLITKPKGSGGEVTLETVKEQLLYEIGDPAHYLSPDVSVSFLTLQLNQEEQDRVKVSGATGSKPPSTYKVSATFRDGYKAEAFLALFGPPAEKKAERCGQMILDRMESAGFHLERSSIECLGAGDIVPGIFNKKQNLLECVLRVAVADHRKAALEHFVKEIAPLVTSGPQGVTGYTSGRPVIRDLFGYWPCLIERKNVNFYITYIDFI